LLLQVYWPFTTKPPRPSLLLLLSLWLSHALAEPPKVQSIPPQATSSHPISQTIPESILARIYQPFFGDLNQLRKRRVIRVLTTYSRTNFFLTPKGFRGLEYDLLKAYEQFLNRGPRKQRYQTQLVFLPVPFKDLLTKLQKGFGDIAAAGLTITPERSALVDFTQPYISNIKEVLISSPSAPPIQRLEDLSGKTITVIPDSSYIIHLNQFNRVLGQLGLPPMEIKPAPALLEIEDLLEMTNNGLIDYTVADSHIAELWQKQLKSLIINPNIIFHYQGQIAWGLRKHTPQLKHSLNQFIQQKAKPGKLLNNFVYQKYFEDGYWIKHPPSYSIVKKIHCLEYYFKRYAEFFDFDWTLIAAQAYQESRFNQHKVSHQGAMGIMQIKPETAQHKPIYVHHIKKLENNIEAGVAYLAFLRDHYFSDPAYLPEDRINFALAAYNAGPTKIKKMQRLAKKRGLNPNKWFYNVETIVRQKIGLETVNYVANIRKFQVILKMSQSIEQNKPLAKLNLQNSAGKKTEKMPESPVLLPKQAKLDETP